MSEEQQDLAYRYDRILIESDDILTPSFAGSTVVLSGAQIELLRNVVHYLDRRSTFVEKYNTLNYTTPDNDNWDDISQIVADLEEKLMGNENTIFGVYEGWTQWLGGTQSGNGTFSALTTGVPSGYIYVVQGVTIKNDTAVRGLTSIGFHDGSNYYYMKAEIPSAAAIPVTNKAPMVLKAGDKVRVIMQSCLDGDVISAGVWGYKMKIPA